MPFSARMNFPPRTIRNLKSLRGPVEPPVLCRNVHWSIRRISLRYISPTAIPTVFRQDLSTITLTILADGDDPFAFERFHRPSDVQLECALEELCSIGAAKVDVDADGRKRASITELGD
jgi:hypothetical protein